MNRKKCLLQGLDTRQSVGIEIGPLANPTVRKSEGVIYYVDYADTDFLQNRYKDDPNVDINKIVPIDVIWGKNSLNEAINGRLVDYIIAAHVIEHVPDLITWLDELHSVLRAGGQVRLAIPDKRYSFDCLRNESRLCDVLGAYLVRARIPQPREILDFCLNKVGVDAGGAWRGEINYSKLEREFTFDGAMWLAQDVIKNGTYHDVHCWVFTPNSLAILFHELAKAGLLKFACLGFIDTEYGQLEFFLTLKASSDQNVIIRSWAEMCEATRPDSAVPAELPAINKAPSRVIHTTTDQTSSTLGDVSPLCVDLDGTLIRSDLLVESALSLFARNPLMLFCMLAWLLHGKAYLKRQIALRVDLDAAHLPYHRGVLEWIREQQQSRPVVLCTASDVRLAEKVAAHVGGFESLLASDGSLNLSGRRKAQVLVDRYGERGFDYVGNAAADIEVWRHAHAAIVVESGTRLSMMAARTTPVARTFPAGRPSLRLWLKALRMHQWIKNSLVALPLLAAHRVLDVHAVMATALAFLSFGCCASSVYLTNDLLDLAADRQHHRKRHRPFAAGDLPLMAGPLVAGVLLLAGFVFAWFITPAFMLVLLGYYILTTAYSLRLKRQVMLDVVALAMLYTTRILAGAAAIHAPPSFWLLAFSMFVFLSLAMVKRYTELLAAQTSGKLKASGRGYDVNDIPLIQSLGGSSGYLAVLVLALYIDSTASEALYRHPHYLWMLCPLLLYWISRTWAIAHRGHMHDDPVVFAIKDKVSRIVLLLCGVVALLAV